MCIHDAPCGLPSGVKLHVQPNGLRDIRWNLERGTMMVHVVFALDFFIVRIAIAGNCSRI